MAALPAQSTPRAKSYLTCAMCHAAGDPRRSCTSWSPHQRSLHIWRWCPGSGVEHSGAAWLALPLGAGQGNKHVLQRGLRNGVLADVQGFPALLQARQQRGQVGAPRLKSLRPSIASMFSPSFRASTSGDVAPCGHPLAWHWCVHADISGDKLRTSRVMHLNSGRS